MNISPLINLYFGKSGLWRRRISTVWDSKWQSLYWRWTLIKPQYICEGVKIQKLYLATLILSYKAVPKYCPYAIADGLFRVDVMQRADESFIVKEFESFEAADYSRDDPKEALVHS